VIDEGALQRMKPERAGAVMECRDEQVVAKIVASPRSVSATTSRP